MALEHESDSALARAVRAVGSQSEFGRIIGKRQSVVSGWLRRGLPLPGEHVLAIEAKTNISRHDLNPEVFGAAQAPANPPALLDAQR